MLIGSCSSIPTTPTAIGVPYELEVLEGAYGRHTVTVRAIDEMGNVDPTPATRTWTYVDVNSPDTSIDIGPEEETEGTIAVFEFTGEDFNGQILFDFECSLDNADFTPCTSPHTVEGLTIGAHHFQVRAVNPNGVVDSTPELVEWLIIPPLDAGPPDTFIAARPRLRLRSRRRSSASRATSSSRTSSARSTASSTPAARRCSSCTGLTAGQHTLEVRALRFISEIVDPTPASFTWTVVGEPDTIILSGPPAVSGRASATFTFRSDQQNVTFFCSVDGSMPVPCTSPFIAGPLTQDGHEFEVYAANQFFYLDGERVQDQEPATWEWEVMDVTPPDTTIVVGDVARPDRPHRARQHPASSWPGPTTPPPWFELEFECSLDGGPWDSCDRPYHYLPLEELPGGEHELLVRAVDDFENVDPTPASYLFTTEAGAGDDDPHRP